MIPEKGKKYAIAYFGPYDFNQYGGIGECLGYKQGTGSNDDPYIYAFKIPENDEVFFSEEDIIAEIVDVSVLQGKYDRLLEVHNEAMEAWRNEKSTNTEMELAVINTLLEECKVVAGSVSDNTITLKFVNSDRAKGIKFMSGAKVIVDRK